MSALKRVAVFFGGRSGEHVVSLRSAASIMEAIDRQRFVPIPVGITREGSWLTGPDAWQSLWERRPCRDGSKASLLIDPAGPGLLVRSGSAPGEWNFQPVDIAFPILHGPYGEDGTMQGLLEMAGIPYVGSGVLSSCVAMDKAIMKNLFIENGLPVAPFIYFKRSQWQEAGLSLRERVVDELGFPCFVKPANLGSSVGVTKVRCAESLPEAVEEALLYDDKVVVEKFIEGREIECAVLGNEEAIASRPGEIIPCNEFYDYRAKYIDDRSELIVPVELESGLEGMVRDLSLRAFAAVEASGLARVDFFLQAASGKIYLNEINTIPGFTSISMYPKMWEATGVAYSDLVTRLLELAEERFELRRTLLVVPPE